MSRLSDYYKNEVAPALMKKFEYKSPMQIPKIEKIILNIGAGDAKDNAKVIDNIMADLETITGQKAVPTFARKSVALPRVRDFRGINPNAFDGRGNYSLGIKEQLIFPEIEYDKIEKIRGMDIVFVTTATNDEHARELLTLMGAPFAK